MKPTIPDPVIDEIREIRHRISAMCDHDSAKLVAYFQYIQKQHADRLITSPRFTRPDSVEQVDESDTENVEISQHSTPETSVEAMIHDTIHERGDDDDSNRAEK